MSHIRNLESQLFKKIQQSYLDSPNSVDPSWRAFFEPKKSVNTRAPAISESNRCVDQSILDYRIEALKDAYRRFGYLAADLDPLGLAKSYRKAELDPSFHGLDNVSYKGACGSTVAEVVENMHALYCGSIGAQFMFLSENKEIDWLKDRLENSPFYRTRFDSSVKLAILDTLVKANGVEEFLNVKFKGGKRFSLEGCDAAAVFMEAIIEVAATAGCANVLVGMSHRGRLNFAVNIFGKKYRALFSEFAGGIPFPSEFAISGDVKYHFGACCARKSFLSLKEISVSMLHNPSHLEAVDSVLLGYARAMQDDGVNILPVLFHGDAAFSGQGVVYESMVLESLPQYQSGGVLHIIINNQIGFTTPPQCARKQPFPSFLGEAFDIPIFHINADNPEAVLYVAILASEFRNKFNKSVIIDLISYRRYGHNEIDEPKFTQPTMYNVVGSHKRVVDLYSAQLVEEGIISAADAAARKENFKNFLEIELSESKEYKPEPEFLIRKEWKECLGQEKKAESYTDTAVSEKVLIGLSEQINDIPKDFDANSKVARLLLQRKKSILSGENIDWGNGESLAFASLLNEGISVRLTGQDCKRGTFSHRHAVLFSQSTGEELCPLNTLSDSAKIEVVTSPLSEYGALGFEYGYSLLKPKKLVLWEAQFGDFANGAQIVIDQYISSGEIKWLNRTGLVLLLPHGYEGQGPEHSSARVERFLQLAAENNMCILNCTTPANFFHALRRQVLSEIVRPLVVFTPKSLLRHKMAVSKLGDFTDGSFKNIIYDRTSGDNIRRIVFCSGKVYYDLLAEMGSNEILLVRIEQLYPFPKEEVREVIEAHKNAELIWCQEEPKNMGAWFFIAPLFENYYSGSLRYIGRVSAASPSEGCMKDHVSAQNALVKEALTL